jgi:limonene-1,2-epoxide hydrolase
MPNLLGFGSSELHEPVMPAAAHNPPNFLTFPHRAATRPRNLSMTDKDKNREVPGSARCLYKPAMPPHVRRLLNARGARVMAMPTPGPTEIVTKFLSLWEEPGGLDAAVRDYFLPTTVWQNVGLATTTGPDEAIALNHGFETQFGVLAIRVETLAIAAIGNKVLTERIDNMLDAAGNVLLPAAVAGIFEIDAQGKIAAWRDYFDSAGALALQAQAQANKG